MALARPAVSRPTTQIGRTARRPRAAPLSLPAPLPLARRLWWALLLLTCG
jgi:hypothetical protein